MLQTDELKSTAFIKSPDCLFATNLFKLIDSKIINKIFLY